MKKIRPCPFCGCDPDVTTLGTYIEINCCVGMSIPKSDFLTLEEQGTWNSSTYLYSEEAEEKAFSAVADKWNIRVCVDCPITKKDSKELMESDFMKKVLGTPLPKDIQHIIINDKDLPGCPPGCECPSDKGCSTASYP